MRMWFGPRWLLFLAPAAVAAGGAAAVGLDVGSSNSVVALARHGGVDVVANEASNRQIGRASCRERV